MFESNCVADVETLMCHNPAHHDVICPVVHPLVHYSAHSLCKDFMLLNRAIPSITAATGWQLWWHEQLNECLRQLDVGVQPHCSHDNEKEVVLCGQDIGDLPTTYTVQNLFPHELPVIGTYVDRRIVSGFTYTIRVLGSKRNLFAGNPMLLQSVGCGYGKRISFEGPTLNHNTNYFYSDSHATGCAFSIVAVGSGDHFIVMDSAGHAVGQAIIDCVESQKEVSSDVTPDGSVEKRINVVFSVLIQYSCQPNGKLSLFSDKVIEAMGIVVMLKAKRAAKASVIRLEHVLLPYFGMCSFEPIPKSTK